MAELTPAPFADLVNRLYLEPGRQDSIFELRRNRWWSPGESAVDLSVDFQGHRAGNPLGPAAGPHTQMAQNLLLSYLAGSRILELKTVQANDRLNIPRPCIDMTNVGYNVEWSQELLVEQSIREYVAGWMLIHMLRFAHPEADASWADAPGEFIFDLSVGYDLAGIRGEKVRGFLAAMRDARGMIEQLRAEIPSRYKAARELEYPAQLSNSITLSTFHGCPADEIERICEFLMGEEGFDVIVKMNPPMLGRERLENLLHDVLGYTELTVNPEAYRSGLSFDEGVQLCNRLQSFAASHGRRFGAKFSNTLEVVNHRDFFTSDNKVMYLSGQPLHVITMTLTDEFRRAMPAGFAISFSAGIDQFNFSLVAACDITPITVSTDLLRPGGYGRLPGYLERLSSEMQKCGARTSDEFILRRFGHGDVSVEQAALLNTRAVAELARNDVRYRAVNNRKVPKRIDSQLVTFDCITCDKCLPVCPNAANFTYPTPRVSFDYHDIIVSPNGSWRAGPQKHFEIREEMQIACYSDFCNECGNCDTFCPEYGGPYIKKPTLFGSRETWEKVAPKDGFFVSNTERDVIVGRIKGKTCRLEISSENHAFDDNTIALDIDPMTREPRRASSKALITSDHVADMGIYHTLFYLLNGLLDAKRMHQVNAVRS